MSEEKQNTAKDYLMQIRHINTLINNKQAEIDRLKSLATTITPTLKWDAGAGGGNNDKIGTAIAKIIDLQVELNQEVDRMIELKREIIGIVDQLENRKYIDIIYKRYFEFMTWEQIACEMGKSYQWVCKLHGRALSEVKKILKKISDS